MQKALLAGAEVCSEARHRPNVGELHLDSPAGTLVIASRRLGGDDVRHGADGRDAHALLGGDDYGLVRVVVGDGVEVR